MPEFPLPSIRSTFVVEPTEDGVCLSTVSDETGRRRSVRLPQQMVPSVAMTMLGGTDTPTEQLVDIARNSNAEFLLETARQYLLASLIRTQMDTAVPPPEEACGCGSGSSSSACPAAVAADTEAKLAEASEVVQAQRQRIEQLEEALHQVAGAVRAVGT